MREALQAMVDGLTSALDGAGPKPWSREQIREVLTQARDIGAAALAEPDPPSLPEPKSLRAATRGEYEEATAWALVEIAGELRAGRQILSQLFALAMTEPDPACIFDRSK